MAWELLIDQPMDGARNMAIDAALLADVGRSSGARTILRFYSWISPTISLGRNQRINTAIDVDYCQGEGIGIVHRPTGGRAVLHDDELTYAVVSNDTHYFGDSIYGNYKRVSEALCLGYNRLGVPAVLAAETRKLSVSAHDPPCFLSPSRYELMAGGRKIAGSAQRRVRGTFLQHGSLPITCNREVLARATRMAGTGPLKEEMAGLAELLPHRPTLEQFRDALVQAFQDHFSIAFML